MTEPLHTVGVMDLVLDGIYASSDSVTLAWSAVTGEVFTLLRRDPDQVLEVYGRVPDLEAARELQYGCPADPTGKTLVEGAKCRLAPR
jgi:hypothetical protein